VSNYRRIIRPFLCFLILKSICRGKCYVQDIKGNRYPVTLFLLVCHFYEFLKEGIQIPFCLLRHRQAIKKLNRTPLRRRPVLNLNNPPLYLRTDRASGILAGGPMGHTAGVLNNLERFSANPVFLTTQKIPNLDSRISLHEIFLEKQFRNFDTILLLESSALIFNEALSKRGDLSFSFIYQRYSDYNYSGALIAEKFKIPLVLEFNCPAIWTAKHWAKGLSYEKLANEVEMVNVRLADVVVVVSQPLKNELVSRGVDSDKILVNPNGVDPEIYSPGVDGSEIRRKYNLEGRTVIGFIGTFGKWHGAEVLAEAFGLLLRQYPQSRDTTRLLMIGDGYTMSEVKRQLEVNGVTPESILTGIVPQEEGPAHLAACDLLASPHVPNPDGTPFFGSPTKLFEYMAMGKGIVASDLDQIGEVLQHDHTGWLVKPGDAESLMHGLKFLIDNPETRQRMAEAAQREVVDKYTWKEHTRKIIEKLKERCSNR